MLKNKCFSDLSSQKIKCCKHQKITYWGHTLFEGALGDHFLSFNYSQIFTEWYYSSNLSIWQGVQNEI